MPGGQLESTITSMSAGAFAAAVADDDDNKCVGKLIALLELVADTPPLPAPHTTNTATTTATHRQASLTRAPVPDRMAVLQAGA